MSLLPQVAPDGTPREGLVEMVERDGVQYRKEDHDRLFGAKAVRASSTKKRNPDEVKAEADRSGVLPGEDTLAPASGSGVPAPDTSTAAGTQDGGTSK